MSTSSLGKDGITAILSLEDEKKTLVGVRVWSRGNSVATRYRTEEHPVYWKTKSEYSTSKDHHSCDKIRVFPNFSETGGKVLISLKLDDGRFVDIEFDHSQCDEFYWISPAPEKEEDI